jgi:ABC-type multidrug transport system fused ATPase/permease subunit
MELLRVYKLINNNKINFILLIFSCIIIFYLSIKNNILFKFVIDAINNLFNNKVDLDYVVVIITILSVLLLFFICKLFFLFICYLYYFKKD